MSDGNGTPQTQVDLTGLDAKDQRMLQIMAQACAIGFEAGFTAAMTKGYPIEVLDEKGRASQQLATLPQLLQNLTNSVDDNTDIMEINNELAQDALEDVKPRRKR